MNLARRAATTPAAAVGADGVLAKVADIPVDGSNVSGPATTPLPAVAVRVENGNVLSV